MRLILLMASVSLAIGSCTKASQEETATYQSAAVVAENDRYLIAEVKPGIAQQVGPLTLSGLTGLILRWPADFTQTPISLRIEPGPALHGRAFGAAIGLDTEPSISASTTTIQIRSTDPFATLSFDKDLEILWPRSLFEPQLQTADSPLQVIGLKPGETAANVYTVETSNLSEGDPIRLAVKSSGSFQLISAAGLANDGLPLGGGIGTGSWYGFEANLATFVDRITAADVSHLELIYDQQGNNLHYYENGTEILIPPGSSFADFASQDPLVFDSSSGESLRPWIFSPDQTHGVMFSALGRTAVLLVTMVQRQAFNDLSSLTSLSEISGQWQGISLFYDFDGKKPFFIRNEARDEVTIQYDDEAISIQGTLAGVASSQVTLAESSPFARQLGLYTGIWAGDRRIYLAVSQDRKAVAYMLCASQAASDCGDGKTAQRFDAFKLSFGLLQR